MKQKILMFMLAALMSPAALLAQVSFGKATLWMDGWEHSTDHSKAGSTTYRKVFKMKDLRKAETYHLYLDGFNGGVDARMQVYLNEHLLDNKKNGYVSFIDEMTPYLNNEGDNELKLVAIGKNQEFDRDIYLVTAPKTHLSKWGIEYQYLPEGQRSGSLLITSSSTWIHDEGYSLSAELADDMDGKNVVATSEEIPLIANADSTHHLLMHLNEPKIWSLDTPHLYLLTVMLHKDGKVVCRGKVKVGLKTLQQVNKKGSLLNGQQVQFKKYLYADTEPLGKDELRNKLLTFKNEGYNVVVLRQPQFPGFYDVCDELGMLVFEGKSGKWLPAETNDIYLRDRVHPSVIFDKVCWK